MPNNKKDNSTTIYELKELVRKFCEERDWDQFHNPKDLTIGIVTEASELLEHFRFKSEKESIELLKRQENKKKITGELSDTFYFILRFAQMNKIDLSTELRKKLSINNTHYPIEKSKGSNKKYNEII
jgi:NTP pyrophosphatase (non-canonical NTP hydrolase)